MEIIYPDWIAIQYSVLSSSADVWHWVSCCYTQVYWNPALSINPWISLSCEFQSGLGLKCFLLCQEAQGPIALISPRRVFWESTLLFPHCWRSRIIFKRCFLFLLGETLVAEEQLCVQPHSQEWCVSLQPRLHSSCLCCTALRRPWDTTHPGEKIAWDYIMRDGLVVCMHKRAKLRSCSQFCNDFWLLHFSSAPTLLPIERPYFPPIFHYSVSSASSLLPIPAHLKNHVSVSVSVSCPYFDPFCIYDSHSPLLFLTVVWTNSSLPEAAVSWQIQLPPPHSVLTSDSSFSQTLTQNTFRCTEDFWI